jgi:hypothetical protein
MKITKRQLRRIIKEEKHKILREQGGGREESDLLKIINDTVAELLDDGMDPGALRNELESIADGIPDQDPEDSYGY